MDKIGVFSTFQIRCNKEALQYLHKNKLAHRSLERSSITLYKDKLKLSNYELVNRLSILQTEASQNFSSDKKSRLCPLKKQQDMIWSALKKHYYLIY